MISFRHATVLAGTGDDPVEDATVVVEGTIIRDVLTGTRAGARVSGDVIDCHGRTLMPGLIDAHVHVCALDVDLSAQRRNYPTSLMAYAIGRTIKETLDQGFTTVRDAGGADWGMKEAVDRGLIPGPRMFVSGHPLSQSGGHGDSRTRAESYAGCDCGAAVGMVPNIADGVDEVRRAVRTQLRRGADQIKVMAGGGVASPTDRLESVQYRPDELSAAVAEAQAAGTYVLAHAYTPDAIRAAVEAGVRSIEHGNFLDDATAALMAARGTFLVPTFVTYEKLSEHGRERGLTAAQLAKLDVVLGSGLEGLRRAHQAGVRIASGSDLLGDLARYKTRELAIKASVLGARAALVATTKTNAELLGIADEVGTVEPGKRADLLVVNGDPLADIGLLQDQDNLTAIVKAGEIYKHQV
ncbi:MAG: amidohydrolase family protein [Streptosporangiaceae bacterium]